MWRFHNVHVCMLGSMYNDGFWRSVGRCQTMRLLPFSIVAIMWAFMFVRRPLFLALRKIDLSIPTFVHTLALS